MQVSIFYLFKKGGASLEEKAKNKILIVEPNKEPYTKSVQDIEQALIEIIGELAYFTLKSRIDLVYNAEGKINNLPFNRVMEDDVLCGTFAIVGHFGDEWCSLTSKQIRFYKKQFQKRKDEGLIEFLNLSLKSSSELLNFRLRGVGRLKNFIVSDRKFNKYYKKYYK